MKIHICENQKDWNEFVVSQEGSFLQSFEWGELQKKNGKEVWRFEVKKGEKRVMLAQIIKEKLIFNRGFFYLPYGPCFADDIFLKGKRIALELLLKKLKEISANEGCFFLQIEPEVPLPPIQDSFAILKRIQPQFSLQLNLNFSEEKIFSFFHPKTRYNIGLAQKKGVEIEIINFKNGKNKEEYFRTFWKLLKKTSKRKKFYLHPKDHYKNLLYFLSAKNEEIEQKKPIFSPASLLFLAKYKNKFIAGNIVLLFGNKAIYLHGATNYKYRKLMASHLLQWRQIQEAKRLGFKIYDFWGVDDEKWKGLSRFKRSFLPTKALKERIGKEIQYPEGKNFVFQKFLYSLYKIAKKF